MIARLDSGAIDDLREVLPRSAHVALAHLPHVNAERRRAYWLDEISGSLANESSIAFQSVVSGIINGFIVYNDSPWDSKITGRRIGTVEHLGAISDDGSAAVIIHELIDKLTQSLADRGTQCLVCKVHSDELAAIHALERSGFLLMDTLLDFVFDFSETPIEEIALPKRDEELRIRQAKPNDLPTVMAINEKAFADYFGRYHADPHMSAGAAARIYSQWARSAFEGWADWILIAELGQKIAGYGLWRKPLETEQRHSLSVAHYDLAAIDPEFRGRGLWAALMLDGMRIARDFAQYLIGPVHIANYPVQHILQKHGWKISSARHTFHKWLT